MQSPTPRRVAPGPQDPDQHAQRIAERLVDAWHGTRASDRLEVPLSAVAALCLISTPTLENKAGIATAVLDMPADHFADLVRGLWAYFVRLRPDLVNAAWPLTSVWLHPEDHLSDEAVRAAKTAVDAAVRADLFGLTGTHRREDTDLLGTVLTLLRPRSALQSRGQYYTPSHLALMIADLSDIEENASVCDPTVGTGGMFRAAAQSLRQRDRDPGTVLWVGGDIDSYAVACLAVNAVVWRLGNNVVLGTGDSLTEDWVPRAFALRNEPVQLAASLRRDRAMIEAFQALTAPVATAADSN